MEALPKEYVQGEFQKMKSKNENKTCADCLGKNPTWASIPYGILICMECASLHRSFGVHLTFVRSTLLDTWTAKQMKMMQLGGNENARNFFRQHGFEDQIDQGKLFQKYNSRAAELYRNKLKKMAEGGESEEKKSFLNKEFKEKQQEEDNKKKTTSNNNNKGNSKKDDFDDSGDEGEGSEEGDKSSSFVTEKGKDKKPSNPHINVSKYDKSSTQKKNTGGIEKKKATLNFDAWDEWDDFDKSSEEDSDDDNKKNKKKGGKNSSSSSNKKSEKTSIPTRDNPKTYSHSLAYEDEEDEKQQQDYQSPYQSKKTSSSSSNKNNEDNKSRYQRQPTNTSSSSSSSYGGNSKKSSSSSSSSSKNSSYDNSGYAQDRFKNAKSISSDQYFGTDKDISPQRQSKLNQFSNSKSISSSEYFGEEEEQGDFGASIVETAKNDLNKLKSTLMSGGKKLAEMTKDFFNDFQDRYN